MLRPTDPSVLRKVEHVPGLEREGDRTEQPLVTMPAGSLGVLICYDAALPWVVHDVADAGAQALLAPTDKGSYFGSTLTAWQVATSAIAAIEVGRPLLFVANRGPSVLVDPMQFTVVPILGPQTEGARVVALPHVVGRTAAAAGGRMICTLLLLVAAMAVMRRGRSTTPVRAHLRLPTIALPGLVPPSVASPRRRPRTTKLLVRAPPAD